MKNSSIVLFSLATLAIGTNAAWGESRIERDNAPNRPSTTTTTQPATVPQSSSPPPTTTTVATSPRFVCEQVSGQLTVVYKPQSRPNEAYPWAVPGDMGSSWNSQRRCGEIARRLELYRPDGLQELRTGIENRQNVVCVTTEKNQSCRIVFTVPARQDATATRDQVFRNLTMADSGQQTQGVNTFAGGSNDNLLDGVLGNGGSRRTATRTTTQRRGAGINLKPFLSSEDGGNGSRIGNPVQVPANYRLNPDNFR
jgi:Circadian oscillating protein COP23